MKEDIATRSEVRRLPAQATLRPGILESWRRSSAAGADPRPPVFPPSRVGAGELTLRLQAKRPLLEAAAGHVTWMTQALGATPHTVIVLDREGVVLLALGNEGERQRDAGMEPGVYRSEAAVGTTAAGAALAGGRPIEVVGAEHFARALRDRAGAGAPIRAGDGTVAGALEIGTPVSHHGPERLLIADQAAFGIGLALRDRRPRAIEKLVRATTMNRNERRRRLIADASRLLASSLDHVAVLRQLATLACASFCDAFLVFLAEPDGDLELCAAACRDPAFRPALNDWCETVRAAARDPHTPVGRVLADRAAALLSGADAPATGATTVVAPMAVDRQVLGILCAVTAGFDRSDERDALTTIEDLAGRSANAVLLGRRHSDAVTLAETRTHQLLVVAHEMRSPLTAIIGYADLLTTGVSGPLTEKQEAFIGRIKLGAWHLLHVIEETLTLARTEAGKDVVLLEQVDAAAVLGEALAAVESLAYEKGLALPVEQPAEPRFLFTDRQKVRQILINLLSNAVKYTDRGEVRVAIEPDLDGLVFRITDTGSGIAHDDLEHIFSYDWHAPRPAHSHGAGLGLGIARRLAHILGGDITAESSLGVGSTFRLRLPATTPARNAEAGRLSPIRPQDARSPDRSDSGQDSGTDREHPSHAPLP